MRKLSVFLLFLFFLNANESDISKKMISQNNEELAKKQHAIDKMDSKNDEMLHLYKQLDAKLTNLKEQNKLLSNQIKNQKEKIDELDNQINNIEKTKSEIYPLSDIMFSGLTKTLQNSSPFLSSERKQRIENLKKLLEQNDILKSEQFAKLLEAYEIEYDYSNTIEVYQEQNDGKVYNFLRIGRIGLYKESLDKENYFVWDRGSQKWLDVSGLSEKINLLKAYKIAKKQISPSLITLPISSKGSK